MSTIKVTNVQNPSAASAAITLDTNGQATLNGLAYPTSGSLSGRNRIINGDMRIDQRNAGASSTATGVYTVDRWNFGTGVASKMTYGQNYNSLTPPAGFTNYMGFKTTTAYTVGTTDFFLYTQEIEGYNVSDLAFGTASAKSFTLSFWVNSSLTGTFGVTFLNSAQNRCYPATYTISSANTWEYKTITIPGDTTGTWVTNNGKGLTVTFNLGTGATYSGTAGSWQSSTLLAPTGATSVVGTLNATWNITGVQLEAGSVATPFERRSYGQELALCQRYFHVAQRGITGMSNSGYGGGTIMFAGIRFPVTMRAAPTSIATAPLKIDYPGVANYTQSTANGAGGYDEGGGLLELPNFTGLSTGVLLYIRPDGGKFHISAEL